MQLFVFHVSPAGRGLSRGKRLPYHQRAYCTTSTRVVSSPPLSPSFLFGHFCKLILIVIVYVCVLLQELARQLLF